MTTRQVENSFVDLVGVALGDEALANTVRSALRPALMALPADARALTPDDPNGRYRRLDQDIHQNEVDAYYALAVETGRQLTMPDRLGTLLSPCVPNAGNNCVAALVDRIAPRVVGRPLSSEERAFYVGLHGSGPLDPAALADLLSVLFSAPQLVLRVEHGVGSSTPAPLSTWELAHRLSLHLWQTVPDDELWRAAQDGSLAEEAVYRSHVERLLSDRRARAASVEFIREWLRLEDLPSFTMARGSARYKAFTAGSSPSDGLRDAIADEAVAMVGHFLWEEPGSLSDVLTTRLSFAESAELARLYEIAPRDPKGPPPQFGDPRRAGLLTRSAMLSTLTPKSTIHDARTRPIMKGVFISHYLLCHEVPEPPQNAVNEGVEDLRIEMGARQAAEIQTERLGLCRSCHTQLNPLGYLTEMFDSLGRSRNEEIVWDDAGQEIARWPVKTTISTGMFTDGAEETMDGPDDLAAAIVRSGDADACLVRNYFRYTMARIDGEPDGCALGRMMKSSRGPGGSLRDMFRQAVLDQSFKNRSFQ